MPSRWAPRPDPGTALPAAASPAKALDRMLCPFAPLCRAQGKGWSPFFGGHSERLLFPGTRRRPLSARWKPAQVENARWSARHRDSFPPPGEAACGPGPGPGPPDASAGKALTADGSYRPQRSHRDPGEGRPGPLTGRVTLGEWSPRAQPLLCSLQTGIVILSPLLSRRVERVHVQRKDMFTG